MAQDIRRVFAELQLGKASAPLSALPDLQFETLAAGDLNGDGFDDLVLGARFGSNPASGGENKVVVLFFDAVARTYAPNAATQAALSYSYYPRRGLIADFNGDGLNDLFIGDTGVDDGSRVGYTNRLYLQTAHGLQPVSIGQQEIKDFTHGAVVADFNRDGISDILVLNSLLGSSAPGATSSSYVITLSASGTFTRQFLRTEDPSELTLRPDAPPLRELSQAEKAEWGDYFSGTTTDLNADGIPDLILTEGPAGQSNGHLVVYESIGIGRYGRAVKVAPPAALLSSLDPQQFQVFPTEAIPFDVDGDGRDEIVSAYSAMNRTTWSWGGLYLQVVKRIDATQWVDITASVVPVQYQASEASSRWPHSSIKLLDLDGDGRQDLLLTSSSGDTIARSPAGSYWRWDGRTFSSWTPPGIQFNNEVGNFPIVANLGGSNFVMGLATRWSGELQRPVPQDEYLGIYGWEVGPAPRRALENKLGSTLIKASAGHDVIESIAGPQEVDGGAGIDTMRYYGLRSQYRISSTGSTITVEPLSDAAVDLQSHLMPNDGRDELTHVERLVFADKALAFDIEGMGGTTYRLYQAAFDRVPDASGLGFWMYYLDQGFDLTLAANNFLAAPEFKAIYGENPTNREFVRLLYQHVHHREPDAQGLQFWIDAMENKGGIFGKQWSMGEVLLQFSESPENKVNLIGVMQAGFEYLPFKSMGG